MAGVEAGQGGEAAAERVVNVGPGGLIDTKAYGKLRNFDGKEENWATWSFVARSYFTLLSPDFDALLDAVEAQPLGGMRLARLSVNGVLHSKTLYHILAQSVEGKALSILMNVEKQNGFEGWKALVDAYQPDLGGRHTSMLMGIISPSWEKSSEATFLEDLENWEVLIRRYQDQATDVVTSATKIAILMKYAPASLRNALRTNATNMGTDYDKVKKFIRDWLQSGVTYGSAGEIKPGALGNDKGPAPMDVGAVGYDPKGKPKGKDSKGKGKGKKGDKGGKTNPSGKSSTATFQGECGFCGKWGHKRKDCWAKQAKEKGGGKGQGGGKTTAAVESGPASPTATAAAVYYDISGGEAGNEAEECEDEVRWVMAIGTESVEVPDQNQDDQPELVLYDSGSDENVCPYHWGTDAFDEDSEITLRTVAGGLLSQGRQRRLQFEVLTVEGTMAKVEDLVVGVRGVKATAETAPRYSSQSMGGVGAFQRTLKTDILTMRYDLEARYATKVLTTHNAWPWLVRWAAFVRSRFGLKSNSRTAYQDAFDTAYTGEVLPFGENAMFRTPISKTGAVQGRKRQLKGDSLWRQGIFLGKSVASNEFLFGTEDGVYTGRSVRRLAPAQRVNKELFGKFVGLPWDVKTTLKGPRRLATSRGGADAQPAMAMEGASAPETPAMDIPATPVAGAAAPTTPRAARAEPRQEQPKKRRTMEEEVREQLAEREAEDMDIAARSGSSAARHDGPTGDGMEVEREQDRKRAPGQPEAEPKRLKIGGTVAATLYKPQEELDNFEEYEEAWWDAEGDADEGDKEILDFSTRIPEVMAGKMAELAKMDKYDTYEPRPASEAKGKKILDSTWVITEKPNGTVKCRFCLRDLKSKSDRTDVFAVASSQATSRIIDSIGVKKGYVFFTLDAENAFWQVPIDEECYMYPPEEWLEKRRAQGLSTKVLWKLKKEWYGRRVAGQKFVDWAAKQSASEGFERSVVAPWFFHHGPKDISMEVHMDDFHGTGPEKESIEFLEALSLKMVMKYKIHRVGDSYEHLRRLRTISHQGMFVQPNPKYLQSMLKALGLDQANPAPTPETATKAQEEDQFLDQHMAKVFRSCVGKALYLSFDRPDIQHAVRELTKEMKEPTAAGMNALRRGVFQREGVGRIRHLETKSMWVQTGLKEKKFQLHAVDTQNNAADIHTKALGTERFTMLRTMLGVIDNVPGQAEMRAEAVRDMFNSIKKRVGAISAKKLAAAIMVTQLPGADATELVVTTGSVAMPAEGGSNYLTMVCAALAVMIATVWWFCSCTRANKVTKEIGIQTDGPELSACVPNRKLQDMYVTRFGERVHFDDDCPYIRGYQRGVMQFFSEECAADSSNDSPSRQKVPTPPPPPPPPAKSPDLTDDSSLTASDVGRARDV
ncbi:Retrovirus-related Pol polyprotein from transposon TNT 1-94 [Symbiodinium microadriaticum]|uniref:Retrovirus-related Pol polyprotein from transposon TNT 1-94 n=1 Tax=Symbiodinium microadriaticum TaxID=2951 RepID=A0A1Q9E7P8_SYMMI|nr:Retrovirus-related Pol polyprotein from transposon TNT 1-94 [Symbiodinium microadriaticum]